jgi:serine/threonine protein kinase
MLEWVEGVSLDRWIKDAHRTHAKYVRKAVEFMLAIARAIESAHKQDIIHRDLKPSNVLLRAKKQVVVIDFGLARSMSADWTTVTLPGQTPGTPIYMAPEQLVALQRVSKLTDVHGLGGVLYALLTGNAPYLAQDRSQLEEMMRSNEYPRSPGGPLFSLNSICMKCLSKSPEARFQSAQEVAGALEQWTNENSSEEVKNAEVSIKAWLTGVKDILDRYLQQLAECLGGKHALNAFPDVQLSSFQPTRPIECYLVWGAGVGRKPLTFLEAWEAIDLTRRVRPPDLLFLAWDELGRRLDRFGTTIERVVDTARGYESCGDRKRYRIHYLREHIRQVLQVVDLVDCILTGAP